MDLRCPNCNSTNLKSLSVAFQEGRFSVNASSRLRGVVVGEGGPDVARVRVLSSPAVQCTRGGS